MIQGGFAEVFMAKTDEPYRKLIVESYEVVNKNWPPR